MSACVGLERMGQLLLVLLGLWLVFELWGKSELTVDETQDMALTSVHHLTRARRACAQRA